MNHDSSRKTLLFDFDGTMVESFSLLVKIYNRVAPGFKCKTVSDKEVESLRNKKPQEFMKEYGVTLVKLPFIVIRMRKEVKKEILNIKPVNNILRIIHDLKNQGYTIGMLTTNSRSNIRMYQEKFSLQYEFDFIHTVKNIFGKHNSLKRIMKLHGINPEDLVYIGDETRDIEAAHKAGIKIMAATWGFQDKKILSSLNPWRLVDSPDEIPGALIP